LAQACLVAGEATPSWITTRPPPRCRYVLKARAVVAHDLHAVRGVDDHHVGGVELGGGGELHRAVGLHAAPVEQLRPFGEEARVVVLVGTMGFHARADENAAADRPPGGRPSEQRRKARDGETEAMTQ
jgi:hypothetical protein